MTTTAPASPILAEVIPVAPPPRPALWGYAWYSVAGWVHATATSEAAARGAAIRLPHGTPYRVQPDPNPALRQALEGSIAAIGGAS